MILQNIKSFSAHRWKNLCEFDCCIHWEVLCWSCGTVLWVTECGKSLSCKYLIMIFNLTVYLGRLFQLWWFYDPIYIVVLRKILGCFVWLRLLREVSCDCLVLAFSQVSQGNDFLEEARLCGWIQSCEMYFLKEFEDSLCYSKDHLQWILTYLLV